MRLWCLGLLTFFCLKSYGQLADSVLLEGIIVEDKRLFNKETAGGKITKIDSLVLSENLNHTLSEVLSENTPIFIKSYGRGSMATASFRGTAPSHTQVLWNGISINSPMLGMVDFSLLPVYFIDDLTLEHGGTSVENIGGALGGSISISNKPDWNNKLSGRLVTGYGSFNTFEEFGQLNIGNNRFQSKTRAYYTYSKNDFPFVNDQIYGHPTQKNEFADYTMYSFMQELYGKLNVNNIISFKGWFHNADRSIPRLNSFEGDENANINRQDDRTWRLQTTFDHYYGSGKLSASIGLNMQELDYQLLNRIGGQGFESGVYSISTANSLVSRLQLNHDLSGNTSLNFNINFNKHFVHTTDSVKKTGYEESRDEILMFLGYYHTFWDQLNIRAAIRQDYIDTEFIPFIPYLGFDFKVFPEYDFYLKANITRNYHVPTLNDLYWQPGGNPDLRPEKGITQEVGFAWKGNMNLLNVETQVTGFYSDITDWILWVPNFKGYWEPHNVQKVEVKGIEVALKAKYRIGQIHLTVNGNYAYTRSLNFGDINTWGDESYGKQLVYIPVHSGNLFVNLVYKSYKLTWQHNSFSRRFTTSSNDFSAIDNLPNYFMNQLFIGKEFLLNNIELEARLNVYNLFDEYYRSVLSRRMPGRNYMFLLMMRF
jgi:iron complex outermembrane receptor protein